MRNHQRLTRKVATVVIFLLMFSIAMVAMPTTALAYNCSGFHCYGVAIWRGGTSGAFTNITVQGINDNDPPGFLNNEMWLIDEGCYCWIEAGYKASSGSVDYFWSENKPSTGFIRHYVGVVPGGDYGGYVAVFLYDYGSYLHVSISSRYFSWQDDSLNNPANPNRMDIGLELAGTQSASAPEAHWDTNAWYTNDGQYHYQTNPLPVTSGTSWDVTDPPVHASFSPYPSNSSSGGTWTASCC